MRPTPSKPILSVYHVGTYRPDSPNGIHKFIYTYGQVLSSLIDFNVVDMSHSDPNSHTMEQIDQVQVHRLPRPRMRGFVLRSKVESWLKTLDPATSVFHLHGVFQPTASAWARLLKREGFRYVYTPHDAYSEPSLQTKYWIKRAYIQLIEKYILNNAVLVHAHTQQGWRGIAQYTNPDRIHQIANVVLPLKANTQMNPAQRRYICFVGRLDIVQKGVDLMLRAYAELKANFPDPPPFVLVGPDDEGKMPELEALCEKLGLKLDEEVIFAGRVSEAEKSRYLSESRVYLQLSRFEGFGISIVEAMSLGVPVVISDNVPIHQEIVKNGGGFMATTPAEAAQALKRILELSDAAYTEQSQKTFTAYQKLFSPEQRRDDVITIYRKALE